MTTPLLVTGDFERGRAAKEETLQARRKEKSDTQAEIKRLREVNAELLEAARKVWRRRHAIWANDADNNVDPYSPLGQALLALHDVIEKAEHS